MPYQAFQPCQKSNLAKKLVLRGKGESATIEPVPEAFDSLGRRAEYNTMNTAAARFVCSVGVLNALWPPSPYTARHRPAMSSCCVASQQGIGVRSKSSLGATGSLPIASPTDFLAMRPMHSMPCRMVSSRPLPIFSRSRVEVPLKPGCCVS